MSLKEKTTHLVVDFYRETKKKKKCVDLVVRSWVSYSQSTAKWTCKFPPPEDHEHLIKWVTDSISPNEDFIEYEVLIVKEASSYSQGMKYLKQSYTTAEIKSVDGDQEYDPNDSENPKIYSENESAEILNVANLSQQKKQPCNGLNAQKSSTQKSGSASERRQCSASLPKDKKKIDSLLTGSQNNMDDIIDTSDDEKSDSEATGSGNNIPESDDSGSDFVSGTSSDNRETRMPINSKNMNDVKRHVKTIAAQSRVSSTEVTLSSKTPMIEHQNHIPINAQHKKKVASKNAEISSTPNQIISPTDEIDGAHEIQHVTIQDLKEMEERIVKKIGAAKRSVLYNVSKIYRVVKTGAVARNQQTLQEQDPPLDTLEMNFPLENIEDFENLETKLQDPAKKESLKIYMMLFSCGSTALEDISNILPEIIKKRVQLLHSGSGRIQKGICKRNFSATMVYSCMEEILMKKYAGKVSPKHIRSFTGTWLARAGDREGGKAERVVRATVGKT